MAATAKKKELKVQHFQNPDDLVKFFNDNELTLVAIVAYDRFQALYYYENQ